MKKLVTHNNGFHADDVTAYAILKEVLSRKGEEWTITRTRDQELIDQGDIVFDVGDVYDSNTHRYDHHQRGRAGTRENGILYAAAGLVWKHFGKELCSSETVWMQIDKALISELDAIDNGQNYIGELLFKNTGYTSLAIHAAHFESFSLEEKSAELLLEEFEQASEFMRGILVRMITSVEALEQAFQEASDVYKNTENKQLPIFQKNYTRPIWKRLAEYPEPIFVIYYKKNSDSWRVEAVPVTPITMESRKYAPDAWRGLKSDELQNITGVSDAIFCHPSGYLFGAHSFEGAMKLAKMAISM